MLVGSFGGSLVTALLSTVYPVRVWQDRRLLGKGSARAWVGRKAGGGEEAEQAVEPAAAVGVVQVAVVLWCAAVAGAVASSHGEASQAREQQQQQQQREQQREQFVWIELGLRQRLRELVIELRGRPEEAAQGAAISRWQAGEGRPRCAGCCRGGDRDGEGG